MFSKELKLYTWRLVFSKELKLYTWRLVVSNIIDSFNSSLNTRLHVQSFSNSSMTTNQHVNIQLQFSAFQIISRLVRKYATAHDSCYVDLSCNNSYMQ